MYRFSKNIVICIIISWCLSACAPVAPKGIIVTTVLPGEIDLTRAVSLEGDALYQGIVVNKVNDPHHTNKAYIVKSHLENAIRSVASFNIVESGTNINKPSIDIRIDKFLVKKDKIQKGFVTRKGLAVVQFSLVSTSGNVVDSISEIAEINNTKPAGAMLLSRDAIENKLAQKVCVSFVKRLVPTRKKEYRVFAKGNSQVQKGIKAALIDNWDYAIKTWEEVLGKNFKNAPASYNLGIAYEVKDMLRRSLKMYRKASEIDPLNELFKSTQVKMSKKVNALRKVGEIRENVRDESCSASD